MTVGKVEKKKRNKEKGQKHRDRRIAGGDRQYNPWLDQHGQEAFAFIKRNLMDETKLETIRRELLNESPTIKVTVSKVFQCAVTEYADFLKRFNGIPPEKVEQAMIQFINENKKLKDRVQVLEQKTS